MNTYKIKFADDTFKIVIAKTALEVIKKYNLATREHSNTRIIQLEGEQKAEGTINSETRYIVRIDGDITKDAELTDRDNPKT
jgi:hypothetical protein